MLRIAQLACLIFGLITGLLVGTLADVRSTPPNRAWVLFTDGFYLYRMFSDGTKLTQIGPFDNDNTFIETGEQPGQLLTIEQHLNSDALFSKLDVRRGQQQAILQTTLPAPLNDYHQRYYDAAHETFYQIVTHDTQSQLWILDLRSGQQTVVDMPITPSRYRTLFSNGGYVFWSDANSGGDLYQFRFGNPPTVTRLTTRGDISGTTVPISLDGWVYFYLGEAQPPAKVALYRVRTDGSDEQVVIPEMLLPSDVSNIRYPDPTKFFYWVGDFEHLQGMLVNLDGSNPTPIAITPFEGRVIAWSADRQWMYYLRPTGTETSTYGVSDLYRMNVQTGESESYLVLASQQILQDYWTTDGDWLLLLIQDITERKWLYRLRPDGSEFTQMGAEIRDYWAEIYPYDRLLLYMYPMTPGNQPSHLYLLNLATLDLQPLAHISAGSDRGVVRRVIPLPDFDWQPRVLLAVGGVIGAIGVIGQFRRRR